VLRELNASRGCGKDQCRDRAKADKPQIRNIRDSTGTKRASPEEEALAIRSNRGDWGCAQTASSARALTIQLPRKRNTLPKKKTRPFQSLDPIREKGPYATNFFKQRRASHVLRARRTGESLASKQSAEKEVRGWPHTHQQCLSKTI